MQRERFSYPKFLDQATRHCTCCPRCTFVPCDDIQAGSLCRQECICDGAWGDVHELNFEAQSDQWDLDDDPFEEDWEDAVANCSRMPDGACLQAGSEYCDFECPLRDQ